MVDKDNTWFEAEHSGLLHDMELRRVALHVDCEKKVKKT